MNKPARTEMRNPASMHMDQMNTTDLARLVITANYDAVKAVEMHCRQFPRQLMPFPKPLQTDTDCSISAQAHPADWV